MGSTEKTHAHTSSLIFSARSLSFKATHAATKFLTQNVDLLVDHHSSSRSHFTAEAIKVVQGERQAQSFIFFVARRSLSTFDDIHGQSPWPLETFEHH